MDNLPDELYEQIVVLIDRSKTVPDHTKVVRMQTLQISVNQR